MNRFKFRLETLLDMRLRMEEQVKMRLAEKNNNIILAQNEVKHIYEELKTLQDDEKKQRIEIIDPVLLRYSISYRYKLKKDLLNASRKVDDCKAEAYKVQLELIEATKKRRAVEIVKERRLKEWKKEYNAKEQAYIDDLSQQAYIRNLQ